MADDLMLTAWLRAALEAAGVTDAQGDLVTDEGIAALLDLARDAAHGVARPAAPLATFAAGVALGRRAVDLEALRSAAAAIGAAAAAWEPDL